MGDITNTDVIKAWATVSQENIENFGDEGDITRKHLLNPAIFKMPGKVHERQALGYRLHGLSFHRVRQSCSQSDTRT